MANTFIYIMCAIIILLMSKQSKSFSYNSRHTPACGNEEEQQFLMEEFKSSVEILITKNYMNSTSYLLRWLKASNCDLDLANEKFRDFIEWRKENKVDSIFLEDFTKLDPFFAYGLEGFDKDGRPIMLAQSGGFDFRKMALAGESKKCVRMAIRNVEVLETIMHEKRQTSGSASGTVANYNQLNAAQMIGIFDITGFSVKKAACLKCLQTISEILITMEKYYPLGFYRAYFINSPRIFDSTMSFMKNFLEESTKEIMQVFDLNKQSWSEALLEQINKEDLSEEYGGTKSKFIINGKSYSPGKGRLVLFNMYVEKFQQDFIQDMEKTTGPMNNSKNAWVDDIDDAEFRFTNLNYNISTESSVSTVNMKGQQLHHHHYIDDGNPSSGNTVKCVLSNRCREGANETTITSSSSGPQITINILSISSLVISNLISFII